MKLKLEDDDVETPFNSEKFSVKRVRIPLQHTLENRQSQLLKKTSWLKRKRIGKIPDGELGANIHSSINGKC